MDATDNTPENWLSYEKNTMKIDKYGVKPVNPECFLLRPHVEKAYGYSRTVKIGNSIKISGAVSMDDEGNPAEVGDFEHK